MTINLEKFVKAKRLTGDFVFDEILGQLLVKAASTTTAGKVELATGAEAIAGVDALRAITPLSLKSALDQFALTVTDKYVTGLAGYNATTHALILLLSDGSTSEVSMIPVIDDMSTSLPQATTSAAGVTQYATPAVAAAGVANDKSLTPAGLAYALLNMPDMFGTP